MKIIVASDHAGVNERSKIVSFLTQKKYQVVSIGPENENNSVDYPDIVKDAIQAKDENDLAILLCGTGIGVSIAANKYSGVRAALIANEFTAKTAKEHNNANVLCFGTRVQKISELIELIEIFMHATYEGGRHDRRIEKIEENIKNEIKG